MLSLFHTPAIIYRYLREVGFPDNVLEARVARINLYRTLMTGTVEGSAPPLELVSVIYSVFMIHVVISL